MTEEQTLWELVAYIDGHNRANGGDKVEPPSDDEFDMLLARHNLSQTVN